MSRTHETRQSGSRIDLNRSHEIQPKQREVGEIVLRQLFAAKVGVKAPQTTETLLGQPPASLRRQDDPRRIADDDVLDVAASIDENTNLTPDLRGYFGQVTGELRRDDLSWRDATLVNLLEPSYLIWLQSLCLAFDLWNG
jgi:hypothetical protein